MKTTKTMKIMKKAMRRAEMMKKKKKRKNLLKKKRNEYIILIFLLFILIQRSRVDMNDNQVNALKLAFALSGADPTKQNKWTIAASFWQKMAY